jgi:hypothetical protein
MDSRTMGAFSSTAGRNSSAERTVVVSNVPWRTSLRPQHLMLGVEQEHPHLLLR